MTEPQPHYRVTQVSSAMGWAPMPSVTPAEMLPPRPATLTAASWVWLAATLFGVLTLPLLMRANLDPLANSAVEESLRDPDPLTIEEARLSTTIVTFGAVFGMAVMAVPFVIAALKLRSGRNWPRVLLCVLGGIALIYNLALFAGALASPAWQLGVAMTIATAGLTVAAIVLMFLPPSNSFVKLADR
jgi:hypothetical protein